MQTRFNNIQSPVNQKLPSPALYWLSLLPQPAPNQMLSYNSHGWQLHKNLHSISMTSDRSPHQLQLWRKDSFSGDVTPQSHSTLASDGPADQKRICHQGRKETQLLISKGFLFFPFFLFHTHQGIIMDQLNSDSSLCKWHLNEGKQLTNKGAAARLQLKALLRPSACAVGSLLGFLLCQRSRNATINTKAASRGWGSGGSRRVHPAAVVV